MSVENELCELCVRVYQFGCVIYFSLSWWQPTPEELINMTKKIHHILSVSLSTCVCVCACASVYVHERVSLRGTRSWCLCWLINTIWLCVCLMWLSDVFFVYQPLPLLNQHGFMVRRRHESARWGTAGGRGCAS